MRSKPQVSQSSSANNLSRGALAFARRLRPLDNRGRRTVHWPHDRAGELFDQLRAVNRALERLEAAELELREVRRRMDRQWELVEKTDLTMEEILPRIRHHLENQERLEQAADEAHSIPAWPGTGGPLAPLGWSVRTGSLRGRPSGVPEVDGAGGAPDLQSLPERFSR